MLLKMLKILLQLNIILLIFATHHTINAANERLLKINTDLTAGVIDANVGAGGSASVVNGGSVDVTKQNQNQNRNVVISTEKVLNLSGNALETHICTREETYVEQLKVPSMQPVRVRSSNWCLEFPPRCSEYKTEMREVIKVQNITKTRTIRFCCAGYEGNISSINDTICKPVCRGGCGRGFCQTPDVCSCEAGYTGTHCTQRCDHDHWGLECKNECQCQNGAVCDNKSGICHCTTGWTGDFCELPCPPGTYGVMCHKSCDCVNKRCHPQSGTCEQPQNTTPNVIETLNSTIANITHNLNQIAKKIVNIATTTEATILVGEVNTPKSILPEVIVIKQDEQHTPKIILHQQGAAGLLEDLHSSGAKTPEVIHVITGWPGGTQHNATEPKLELAGFGGGIGGIISNEKSTPAPANTAADHDANLLTVLLIILLIIIIAISMSFLYVYRRYHWQRERVEAVIAARNGSTGSVGGGINGGGMAATTTSGGGLAAVDVTLTEAGAGGKNYLKPLPDLPAFTQMVRNKIEGPVYYDSPSNNSSIHNANSSITSSTYDYARKHSLYSIVSPKSRKGSPDSHLYDEIRYPSAFQHHQHGQHLQHSSYMPHAHHHQQPHQHHPQQQHHQHQSQLHHPQSAVSPQQHHITHLVIPPQNANFLQVPPMSHTSVRKVAHL